MLLLSAIVQTFVKFVILAIVMVLGINLGKMLRIRKDAKNDKE